MYERYSVHHIVEVKRINHRCYSMLQHMEEFFVCHSDTLPRFAMRRSDSVTATPTPSNPVTETFHYLPCLFSFKMTPCSLYLTRVEQLDIGAKLLFSNLFSIGFLVRDGNSFSSVSRHKVFTNYKKYVSTRSHQVRVWVLAALYKCTPSKYMTQL